MQAREIIAFVHRSRVSEVVNALQAAGFRNVSLLESGDVQAFGTQGAVSTTVKLELICDNESQTAEAIALIREHARTPEQHDGRLYISALLTGVSIGD